VKYKLESIQVVDNNPFELLQEILDDTVHEELNRIFQILVQRVQEGG
jgi:hypothetical protein